MGRRVRHYIFENLLIVANKITIKPISLSFFICGCGMNPVTCQLALIKLALVFTAIIKKQISLPVSSKIFDISVKNLSLGILDSCFSYDFALDPVSLNCLAFWKDKFSLSVKFVQK